MQAGERWLDGRVVPILFVALAATLPALLGTGPVSSAWGLLVAVVALVVCRRRIGGGRAGAGAGALVGAIVAAPAALPPLAVWAFRPYTQGPDAPALETLKFGETLIRALGAVGLATLAATLLLPLAFAALGWSAPEGNRPAPPRLNRRIPHFLLPLFLLVAVAEATALLNTTREILAFFEDPQRAPREAGVGWLVSVGVLLSFRLATLTACGLAMRRHTGSADEERPPAPGWASLGMFSLLFTAGLMPEVAFGLVMGFGPVSGIVGWTKGGAVTVTELERLYWIYPLVQAGYVAFFPLLGGLVLGLLHAGGWLVRRLAPRKPGADGPPSG